MIKIVECPRDAMQGIKKMIPAEDKAIYINQLLKVGFDTIDCGSFVSPRAIPQMADTALVLSKLDLSETNSKLSVIVANKRGAIDAAFFEQIDYLGYPFSISETFQKRNTNATIEESMDRVEDIQKICQTHHKQLLIYISMGFGNPYNDPWNTEEVAKWVERLAALDITLFALSDTIGVANPQNIQYIFSELIPQYPNLEIGAHFHTTPNTWREKVDAAYKAGCKRFEGALKGYGGCPMAKDELTGNMPTENLLQYFKEQQIDLHLNEKHFKLALQQTQAIFNADITAHNYD